MHQKVLPGRGLARLLPIAAAAAMAAVAFLAVRDSGGLSRHRADATVADPAASEGRPDAAPSLASKSYKTNISYADARSILDAHLDELPTGWKGKAPSELEAAWPEWVSRHDAEIRRRLERGDEDSIVNLWLYGTTFTALPRATARDIARIGGREKVEGLLLGRLDDLVTGLASPGANERLRFARQVIARKGIDPATAAGRKQAMAYLIEAREQTIAESARYRRRLQSANLLAEHARLKAYADVYRDRGLSSDTSILVDFAVERALEEHKAMGGIGAGGIRRVAIVGPGLDFTDKIEGYDFYPQQTIQPFALVDSLIRLGLSNPEDLRVTTFDLSPRVNQHLEAARERARAGEAYVLQLPLDKDVRGRAWSPDLVEYWQRFGDAIGEAVEPIAVPPVAGDVRLRAVRVRPHVVLSIVPHDLNIVIERLDPIAGGERFDLIVATNILVYYDAFEQALALANVAHMLRPGGFFLTNYAVTPAASMEPAAALITKVYWDRQYNGDTLLWYTRH